MMSSLIKIFSGNANKRLAGAISTFMDIPLAKLRVEKFRDQETRVEILESVRGVDVFLIQPTCMPANDYFMELVIMADALRRASARRITAVMPYFGYARQDRRILSTRVPITARVVADMLASVGIGRLLTVDLHSDQIQGFFYMPVDNLYAAPIFIDDLIDLNLSDLIVVSPDVGGVVRARAIAKRLGDTDLAIVEKRRPEPNMAEIMHIIGDVKERNCVLIDDIIDTGGTMHMAAKALKERGAKTVRAYCTHAVLSGDPIEALMDSEIDELVVTDTIPLSEKAKSCNKIRVLSLAPMLARMIRRIHEERASRT